MRKIRLATSFILVLVLFSTVGGAAAVQPNLQTARLQSHLADLAQQNPSGTVRVIVQKAVKGVDSTELMKKYDGQILQDLSLINAFSALMSASAAAELSHSPAVRWVSLDAPMESANARYVSDVPEINTYLDTLNVYPVWDHGIYGENVSVAVVDSGIDRNKDFSNSSSNTNNRVLVQLSFSTNSQTAKDIYGHGTHVAGIVGGNGHNSNGAYMGIAPGVHLISLKINDENGMAYESDTVAALQWVYENKDAYNIRVVNLSLNTIAEQSYHTSPMDAAVEILWFNGIVVVASSGNKGSGEHNTANAAPANDPFIITVGASDEKLTPDRSDDAVAPFSAYGITMDGFKKPDLIAPGTDIFSVLSNDSSWPAEHPDNVASGGHYIRLSGTSMAAPMVSGAVALLLTNEPALNPDQVKYRLMTTGSPMTGSSSDLDSVYPYLDVRAALVEHTREAANTNQLPSQLLSTGEAPIAWNSVGWNSVGWNSVGWNSVGWNSVGWNSVGWNSTLWDKHDKVGISGDNGKSNNGKNGKKGKGNNK